MGIQHGNGGDRPSDFSKEPSYLDTAYSADLPVQLLGRATDNATKAVRIDGQQCARRVPPQGWIREIALVSDHNDYTAVVRDSIR